MNGQGLASIPKKGNFSSILYPAHANRIWPVLSRDGWVGTCAERSIEFTTTVNIERLNIEPGVDQSACLRINELEDRRSERISQRIDGGKGTLTALSVTPINPKIWS